MILKLMDVRRRAIGMPMPQRASAAM
jgi:hypothetical protein